MSKYLTPDIGATGAYTFKSPFDKIVPREIKLTCQSVRRISELLAMNVDVYTLHYKKNNILETKYLEDLKDDVSIIGLQSEVGAWFYLPNSYVLSFPNTNGVLYTKVILGVNLGPIPDKLSTVAVETAITDIVYNALGIIPEIKQVAVSQTALVSYDDHDKIEASRKAKVSLVKSSALRIAELTKERDAAHEKIRHLENFIKNKLNLK